MKVAINGFGRIGRAVYRIITEQPEVGIEIVAVNDLIDDDTLAHLLKYDTVGVISAGGHTVKMFEERDPAALPRGKLGGDVVVESTGVLRTRLAITKHLAAGARRVILTVPSEDAIDATGCDRPELRSDLRSRPRLPFCATLAGRSVS